MRPDRVIVGECRGPEALDMVQAMNTGHDGSMTTVHANSAREVIERLEVLILMAADLPVTSIHRQLVSAIDVIVHISRLPGGRRAVTQIAEVTRYDPEEKQVVVVDIFNFRNGVALQPTGYLPSFIDSLVEKELLDLEFLYGQEANLEGGSSKWGGVSVAAQYRTSAKTAVSARVEYFKDASGFSTGVAQNLKELTLTADYRPTRWLLARGEFRNDWSNQPFFDKGSGRFGKSQPTLMLGLVAFLTPKK
jgi:hypothetical protein